jgi:hypothetical protein
MPTLVVFWTTRGSLMALDSAATMSIVLVVMAQVTLTVANTSNFLKKIGSTMTTISYMWSG